MSYELMFAYVALTLLALGICLGARPIGHALGVLDIPKSNGRKKHARVTPLVGGIAIGVPVLTLTAVEAFLFQSPLYAVIFALFFCFLLLGVLDDRAHIAPLKRLLASGAGCAIAAFLVPELRLDMLTFSFTDHSFGLGIAGGILSVLCLVAFQNAVNMADGDNGLAIGLSLIWVAAISLYSPPFLLPVLIVLGSCLAVTMVFNLRGRLFLGDAGSYSLSAIIGVLAIYVYNTAPAGQLSADMIVLWFLIPVLDCARLIFTRVRRGQSPFQGDRNHLHHYLSQNVRRSRVVALYLAMVGGPTAVSLFAPHLTPYSIGLVSMLYGAIVYSSYRARAKSLEKTATPAASASSPSASVSRPPRLASQSTLLEAVNPEIRLAHGEHKASRSYFDSSPTHIS